MAVAYDNDTQALQNANVSSVTFSHTAAGSNRGILVYVCLQGTSQTVSSVTYAGASLSLIGAQNNSDTSGPNRLEVWGLAASATGANNVIVTLSANNTAWDASAISFTGAHQTQASNFTGFQSAAQDNGISASISVTVTTGATNDLVCSGTCSTFGGDGAAPGSGQTQQWLDNSGATNTMGSTKAGGASVTMTENWGTNDAVATIAAVNIVQVSVDVLFPPWPARRFQVSL